MNNELSKGDRMDLIETTVREYVNRSVYKPYTVANIVFYAAQLYAGYDGASYCDAVAVLASKYETAAEIAALPAKVMNSRA